MIDGKIKIAFDAMGGDNAPINEILGVERLVKNNKISDLEIVFMGDKEKITDYIEKNNLYLGNYTIEHTSQIVSFTDTPSDILKEKKDSSLYKGFELVKKGKADAFVSAGNTGAMLVGATFILGRIKGVSRPVIGTYFPSIGKSEKVFVLDVGASVDSKARFFYEYAILGDLFCRISDDNPNPSIGLLSVGEEDNKGTEEIKIANKMLHESNFNFVGNIEGNDVLTGKSDVVLCDGMTGNVMLKFAESIPKVFKEKIKKVAYKSTLNKIKAIILKPFMKEVMKEFDYQEYGGVPILGCKGVAIVCHGKSSPLAYENALLKAYQLAKADFVNTIEKSFKEINE